MNYPFLSGNFDSDNVWSNTRSPRDTSNVLLKQIKHHVCNLLEWIQDNVNPAQEPTMMFRSPYQFNYEKKDLGL